VAFGVGGFVFCEEPEADGNLRAVEELAGQGDHAVHEVGLDEGAADVAFAGLVGGQAAIGEDEAGHALRGEVLEDGGGFGARFAGHLRVSMKPVAAFGELVLRGVARCFPAVHGYWPGAFTSPVSIPPGGCFLATATGRVQPRNPP